MALLLPAAPLLAYFGLLSLVIVLMAAAFWPWVEPRLITFLTNLREGRARRQARGPRLGVRRPR